MKLPTSLFGLGNVPSPPPPTRPPVALAIVCGLSLSLLFHCSVPAKEAQDEGLPTTPSGPDRDAASDANTKEVGLEPAVDADTRNNLCGANTCNPDEGVETCPSFGAAGAGGTSGAGAQACRVVRTTGGTGYAAVCGNAGTVVEQGACQAQTDCGPGLACVGAFGDTAGTCRQYCCYGQTSCEDKGTYCTLLPAFEVGAGADALYLPVCLVPDNCRLLDPTACDSRLVCTFLNGVTTCLEPGLGKDGDDCGCAAGYVCLRSTNTCRRVCHERADAECGGGGTCVSGGATFPEGFGICSK